MHVKTTPANSLTNVVISSTSDDWTENGLIYNNKPDFISDLTTASITADGKYYEWDVTKYVKTTLSTKSVISFGLSDPSNADNTIVFSTKEDATNKPELIISDGALPSNNNVPVTFNNLFSNKAIVQQQKTATPIFGFAGPGTNITVIPSWNGVSYTGVTDAFGKWKINVATPSAATASGSYTITASDEDMHSATITGVKLGEVWFCAGQSNMEMRLKGFGGDPPSSPIKDGPALIAAANDPDIRMFTLPTTLSINAKENLSGTWNEANPTNAEFFSAIAYQYALALKAKLNVPVGVIVSAVGGIPIQSLMSAESLTPFPEVTIPTTLVDKSTPTSVYNGMVNPIAGYGIKGFVWYQGETNRDEPELYSRLFPALIADYRARWNDNNLPFYFVQLAPNNYSVPDGGAKFREVQYNTFKTIPNTGISLPMEVGEASEIHYADKTTPANRLSFIALNKTYGFSNVPFLGPEFKFVSFNNNVATISFNNETGLKIKGSNTSLFEIAGADKVYYAATQVILPTTNQIEVSSANVQNPVAVRYAYANFVVGNLFNGADLPASTFRTKDLDSQVDTNFHVYLLTGQSNMSGRGYLTDDNYVPGPKIKMLKLDGTWVNAANPLHGQLESSAGVGPGISFARKMLDGAGPNVTIGLIPTAIGGQSIDKFEPGVTNTRTNKSIYDESVKYVNIAKTKGVLKGILFHQGESNNGSTGAWVSGVKALVSNFRTSFNQPKLPFVFGEMGRFPNFETKYANILAVMPGVQQDIPYSALVTSEGLFAITDDATPTHFTTASTITLGERYAAAMKGVFITLPVTLSKFTAVKKNEGALIQWTTVAELNNDRFELERSNDGKVFSVITSIKGNGTSASINNYSYTDRIPNQGANYYRLVQYDLDGKKSVSEIIALTFNFNNQGQDFAIVLYPNPAQDKVFVMLKAEVNQQVKVAIYNLQGQQVRQLSFAGGELIQSNIQDLKTGIYVLRVQDASNGKTIGESKFVKY